MELEDGKRYVQRNGAVTGPLVEIHNGEPYPFEERDGSGGWTRGGRYFGVEDDPRDLVALYEEPAPKARMLRLKNGQTVIVHTDHFVMSIPVLTAKDLRQLLAEQEALNQSE